MRTRVRVEGLATRHKNRRAEEFCQHARHAEQVITPLLWFTDEAETAVEFYVSIFADAKIDKVSRFGENGPLPEGTAMMIEFTLEGQEFMALNGGVVSSETDAAAPPRGGIALFVTCRSQAELDALWERLADGGQTMQCGWLRDKFGFVWNVVPRGWARISATRTPLSASAR